MAFVYLDGLFLKVFREGVGREAVCVALGVTPEGRRQVLGYWLPAEGALGWEGVLRELQQRELRRALPFITDGLPGLPEAIGRVYPQAERQRCVVHGARWSLAQVRARERALLAEDSGRSTWRRAGGRPSRPWSGPGPPGEVATLGWWACGGRSLGRSCGPTAIRRPCGPICAAPT